MSDNPPEDQSLVDEFRILGQNLVETFRNAWESQERKRLQKEIEDGLDDLVATLKAEATTFTESPTGHRLKSDIDDLKQRVRSGEAETQVREELLKALRLVNAELQKASQFWKSETSTQPDQEVKKSDDVSVE